MKVPRLGDMDHAGRERTILASHLYQREKNMPAKTPEEICSLFQGYMAKGDIESLLDLYDPEAVFLNESGELKQKREIRHELAPPAAAKAAFQFEIQQVIRSGDIALMHTKWDVSGRPVPVFAIEVARRQPDGTWRWLIGDPFSVGRYTRQPEFVLPDA